MFQIRGGPSTRIILFSEARANTLEQYEVDKLEGPLLYLRQGHPIRELLLDETQEFVSQFVMFQDNSMTEELCLGRHTNLVYKVYNDDEALPKTLTTKYTGDILHKTGNI